MMAKRKPCKVEKRSRDEIADRLMQSVSDEDKVALCLDENDLQELIDALGRVVETGEATTRQKEMMGDLNQLMMRAFP